MNNTVILASAGGRKTQYIVDCCAAADPRRTLVITFASNGQEVLRTRLWSGRAQAAAPEVTGWYAFLINEIVKPYLPMVYPGARVRGLHFVEGADPVRYATGVARYISVDHEAYSHHLGKLAADVLSASCGAVIDRLERIYTQIYIDEVQDLNGNDLDILEALLGSKIRVTLVGDVRQSILQTSRSDRKNKKSAKLGMVAWFERLEAAGLCTIEHRAETWRCNQQVIDLADSAIPDRYQLPRTISHENSTTGHDGVFVVAASHVPRYLKEFSPAVFRHSIQTAVPEGVTAQNFGQIKGSTVDRALIYPTKPIRDWLESRTPLADESACRLYVAISRARFSVAFPVDDPAKFPFPRWSPSI